MSNRRPEADDTTTPKAGARILAAVTIDLCDHDFLASFAPTSAPQTFALGRFKGYDDARYVERPTLGSEVGRVLYEQIGPRNVSMAFGFLAPWDVRLVAKAVHAPAGQDDDGGTEVTIHAVTVEAFDAMRAKAQAA